MITIERAKFRKAVALLRSPERVTSPAYGLITIGRLAEPGWVTFDAATDDWSVGIRVPAEGETDGPFAADSEMLAYIGGSMGAAVSLTKIEGAGVDFFADHVTGMLQTYDVPGAAGSPPDLLGTKVEIGDNPPSILCQAAALADALGLVAQAASLEQIRYYLGGVQIEKLRHGSIGLTATNGHQLMHAPMDVDHISGRWQPAVLRLSYLPRLIAFLRFLGEAAPIRIWQGRGLIRFWGCGTPHTMDIAPLDAGFPDWRRVIPTEDDAWSYRVNVEQFQAACRSIVRGYRRKGVPLRRTKAWAGAIELDSATVTLHAPMESGRETRHPSMIRSAAHLVRGNRRIIRGVNLHYLRTVCDLLAGAKTARVCSPTPGGPMVFRGDNHAIVVLMPMMSGIETFGIEGTWE